MPRPADTGIDMAAHGRAGLLLVGLVLTACTAAPRLAEQAPAEVAAAPYPALIPLAAFPEAIPPAPQAAAIADALDAETGALNARAATLRAMSP